jgi:hypothetical protein
MRLEAVVAAWATQPVAPDQSPERQPTPYHRKHIFLHSRCHFLRQLCQLSSECRPFLLKRSPPHIAKLMFRAKECGHTTGLGEFASSGSVNGKAGLIKVTECKTKRPVHMLPMVPAVHEALKARRKVAGNPEEGTIEKGPIRDWP